MGNTEFAIRPRHEFLVSKKKGISMEDLSVKKRGKKSHYRDRERSDSVDDYGQMTKRGNNTTE